MQELHQIYNLVQSGSEVNWLDVEVKRFRDQGHSKVTDGHVSNQTKRFMSSL